MKNLILLSLLMLCGVAFTPHEIQAQPWSIKIDSEKDPDSLYVMLTDTVYSKYRYGKGKWFNTMDDFARKTFDGGQNYKIEITQATTAAPSTSEVFWNSLNVATPAWSRDSLGNYKLTKTDMFEGYDVFPTATIGNATGRTIHAWRASDSTLIVKVLGISSASVDLGGKAYLDLLLVPTD